MDPRRLLLVATALFLAPVPRAAASAAPVSASAAPSTTEPAPGEPFTIEVKAVGPPGTTFSFPGEASAESFDLRPAPAPGASDPAAAASPEPGVVRYQAVVFALGEVEIPPIPVRYRLPDGSEGETATQPLAFKVRSALPKAADERKLKDIRGPVAVSVGRAFWLALGTLAVVVAALALWLVLRRRARPAPVAAAVPELAPAAEALRALDALAASALLASGAYRAFYIELTAIAKRYLERRLGAPVLEMTSAETVAFLRGHPDAGGLVSTMRDLADAADRIKFARGDGLRDEASRHLAGVRSLVAGLERRLQPAPAEERAA